MCFCFSVVIALTTAAAVTAEILKRKSRLLLFLR